MKPQLNSILKSPAEPGEGKVLLPASFQAGNLKRRVSFGPQQIHEFTVDSTFSQGTSSTGSKTTLSNNQYNPNEESMELTNVANNEMDVNFQSDQFRDTRTRSNVHPILCGRDQPIQTPVRGPLKVWNTNRNNQLPADPLCSDNELKSPFRGESAVDSTQENAAAKLTYLSEVSMELTCMNLINKLDQTAKILEAEQPYHFSPNPVDTSHMSWLNNSQYFDNLDETPEKTSDTQVMSSDICAPTDTPCMPHDTFSTVVDTVCKESNTTATSHHSLSNCRTVLDFSGWTYKEKERYQQYLSHKSKIAKVRPGVNRLLREVEELKEEKLRLENEIPRQVMIVASLKEKLAATKAENERKRTAIVARLLESKEKFLEIQNS